MNSKRLAKRLNKMGYTLDRDMRGWIVHSKYVSYCWRFDDLHGVLRFVLDEEITYAYLKESSLA